MRTLYFLFRVFLSFRRGPAWLERRYSAALSYASIEAEALPYGFMISGNELSLLCLENEDSDVTCSWGPSGLSISQFNDISERYEIVYNRKRAVFIRGPWISLVRKAFRIDYPSRVIPLPVRPLGNWEKR